MTTKIPAELSSTPGITDSSNATAITIDSSENVMIGTTDAQIFDHTSGEGIVFRNGEVLDIARSGDSQMTLNRMSDEGANISLHQAGTLRATIGTKGSGGFYIGTGGDNERIRIDSSGNVGIATSSPAFHLEVQESSASTYAARFMHTGNPNSGPPQIMRLDFWQTPNNGTSEFLKCRDTVSGTAVNRAVIMSNGGIGNFTTNDFNYSDERMKKDINNATAQLDNVKKLQLKTFRYKEQEASEPTNLGVVAQDVQTDFPTLVTEQGKGDEARLGVKEQQIMWMAVKAIQEQQDIIEDLKSRIEALEE